MYFCIPVLYSRYLLNALHGAQFLDECIGLSGIINHYGNIAREETILGRDVDASHDEFVFLGNDVGDIAHDTDIVVSDDAECDGILGCSLAERVFGPRL